LARPNSAAAFPKHVFVRAANLRSNIYDRVGDRENAFKATLLHLTERFHGRDVYLVGTMNSSTMLAQRTKKLIEELKPDRVIVQTSDDWWESAKLLKYVDSQEEMAQYQTRLNRYLNKPLIDMYFNNRKWIFLARLAIYKWLFDFHFRLG